MSNILDAKDSKGRELTTHRKVVDIIQNLFDENDVSYEMYDHAPVFTSDEAAKVRNTSLDMGAKALVWFADKKPILIVVPGDKKLDTNKFKMLFGVKDMRFASPAEVEELTSLKIGSIPPVGRALGLDSYYDESFKDKEMISFNAGSHSVSVTMLASELLNFESPKIAQFAKD